MMTINFDTITNNYEVIYVIKTVMKYYLKKKIRVFISVFQIWFNVYLLTSLHDAIWFMNIHEQNHPGFLAMFPIYFNLLYHIIFNRNQARYNISNWYINVNTGVF